MADLTYRQAQTAAGNASYVPDGTEVLSFTTVGGDNFALTWQELLSAMQEYTGEGAALVAEDGVPNQKSNRHLNVAIDSSHPGDDSAGVVTFQLTEGIRRYRVWPIGTAGDSIKIVEDAVNATQAVAWMTESSGIDAVNEFWVATVGEWSEWKEMSKSPDDVSMTRLDFEMHSSAGANTVTELFVEAE